MTKRGGLQAIYAAIGQFNAGQTNQFTLAQLQANVQQQQSSLEKFVVEETARLLGGKAQRVGEGKHVLVVENKPVEDPAAAARWASEEYRAEYLGFMRRHEAGNWYPDVAAYRRAIAPPES